eukprot:3648687-Prymnesium_polylepis.1
MDALMSMTKEQFMDLKYKKQLLKDWGEALDEEDKKEESEEELCWCKVGIKECDCNSPPRPGRVGKARVGARKDGTAHEDPLSLF